MNATKRQTWIHCALFGLTLLGVIIACKTSSNQRTHDLHLNDPELIPFADMYNVDRERFCLTPIDEDAAISIEYDSGTTGYDVMLHVEGKKVTRSVAFLSKDKEYVWIGEQEVHYSGREFQTVDGDVNEMIVISYKERPYQDNPKGLSISYWGDYQYVNFSNSSPTCEQVKPYISQWGRDS